MATKHGKRDRRRVMTGGLLIWTAFVSAFFLYEIVQYDGLMALLAEWQFNTFGRYYPSVTYFGLIAILASPGLVLFFRVRQRESDQRLAAATLRSAATFRRLLLGLGAASLLAAIGTLILLLMQPSSVGAPRRIDLGQPVVAMPSEGPTVIDGAVLYDRTAAFDENLLVARRTLRFAPIVAPGSTGADLQFFVELPPETTLRATADASQTGVLKRNALPGEIVQLFRYAGYRVEPPYYVLFASDASLRWPLLVVAGQFALLALVFLSVGVWQHRRIRWLEQAVSPSSGPVLPPTAPEPASDVA